VDSTAPRARARGYRALLALPLVALFVVALAPPLAAQAADGASWSVAPQAEADGTPRPRFEYAVEPGQVVADAFQVRNDGAAPLTLAIYASDAFTTREGNIDLLPAGEPATDAGSWVSLDAAQVVLQPGETATVPFSLGIPADARPGDHTAGIVASLTSDDPEAQVQVDRRLGSRMYIRVAGELAPAVEVSAVSVDYSGMWNPLALGELTATYSLRNTGDTRVTAVTSLDVSGPFGAAAASTSELQLNEVLPGSEIDVTQQLSGVGALLWLTGAVDVRPSSVGLGAGPLEAVEETFSIAAVPVALLLILLGVALIVVAIVVVVRRRGGKARASAR